MFGHLPLLEEVTPFSECLNFFPFQIRTERVRGQPVTSWDLGSSWQRYPVARRVHSSVQGCGSGDGLQIFLALRCHLETLGNMISPPPFTSSQLQSGNSPRVRRGVEVACGCHHFSWDG